MIRYRPGTHQLISLVAAIFFLLSTHAASACSRAVYFGKEGQTVVGRIMNWLEDVYDATKLDVFQRPHIIFVLSSIRLSAGIDLPWQALLEKHTSGFTLFLSLFRSTV